MRNLAIANPPVRAVADPNQATATLAEFYARMALIRATERALLDLFARGKLRGTVHTRTGQEAIAVGVVSALDRSADAVLSNDRGVDRVLACREDVHALIADALAKATADDIPSDGVAGRPARAAAEIATAMKQRDRRAITVLFHGDGAADQGAIGELLTIAAQRRLPLLLVIANGERASGDLTRRGDAQRIPRIVIDGTDVMAVYDAASRAVAAIRSGNGPRILVCDTVRLCQDGMRDDGRDPAAVENADQNDALILAEADLDAVWCRVTRAVIAAEVAAVVAELAAC